MKVLIATLFSILFSPILLAQALREIMPPGQRDRSADDERTEE
jgi:hypothetical protein